MADVDLTAATTAPVIVVPGDPRLHEPAVALAVALAARSGVVIVGDGFIDPFADLDVAVSPHLATPPSMVVTTDPTDPLAITMAVRAGVPLVIVDPARPLPDLGRLAQMAARVATPVPVLQVRLRGQARLSARPVTIRNVVPVTARCRTDAGERAAATGSVFAVTPTPQGAEVSIDDRDEPMAIRQVAVAVGGDQLLVDIEGRSRRTPSVRVTLVRDALLVAWDR